MTRLYFHCSVWVYKWQYKWRFALKLNQSPRCKNWLIWWLHAPGIKRTGSLTHKLVAVRAITHIESVPMGRAADKSIRRILFCICSACLKIDFRENLNSYAALELLERTLRQFYFQSPGRTLTAGQLAIGIRLPCFPRKGPVTPVCLRL